MRDNQKSAVYRWEAKLGDRHPQLTKRLSLDECRAYIAKVWADYRPGEDPPAVVDGRGTTTAYGYRWRINLPRWARIPRVVLHEVAHSLLYPDYTHGPTFARFLADLYEHYEGIPWGRMRRLGREQHPRRVRFANLLAACPRRIRTRHQKEER